MLSDKMWWTSVVAVHSYSCEEAGYSAGLSSGLYLVCSQPVNVRAEGDAEEDIRSPSFDVACQ
jgi:hypothetical protein